MNSNRRIRARGAAALAALALCASSGGARADDVGNEPSTLTPEQALEQAEWAAVADTELLKRGTGASFSLANAEQHSLVLDNHVGDNVTSGDVSITDNAFSGMHGIMQSTFNTGNNNSIQSNLVIIINLD